MLKQFLITKSLECIYIKEKYNNEKYLIIEWKDIIEVNNKLDSEFCAIYEERELIELINLQDKLIHKLNMQLEKKAKEKKLKKEFETREEEKLIPLNLYLNNFKGINKERIKKTLLIKEIYTNNKGGKSAKPRFEKLVERKKDWYIVKDSNKLIKDWVYTIITKTEALFFHSL